MKPQLPISEEKAEKYTVFIVLSNLGNSLKIVIGVN